MIYRGRSTSVIPTGNPYEITSYDYDSLANELRTDSR